MKESATENPDEAIGRFLLFRRSDYCAWPQLGIVPAHR